MRPALRFSCLPLALLSLLPLEVAQARQGTLHRATAREKARGGSATMAAVPDHSITMLDDISKGFDNTHKLGNIY